MTEGKLTESKSQLRVSDYFFSAENLCSVLLASDEIDHGMRSGFTNNVCDFLLGDQGPCEMSCLNEFSERNAGALNIAVCR